MAEEDAERSGRRGALTSRPRFLSLSAHAHPHRRARLRPRRAHRRFCTCSNGARSARVLRFGRLPSAVDPAHGRADGKGGIPVDVATSLPSLTPYRLIFVMDPMGGFASDSPALTQFWKAGGTLALVGECASFAGQANADINTFLNSLGSPLSIVTASDYPDSTCTMYTAMVSASSPWTAGVTGLKFAWTSKISGGLGAIASYGNDTLVAGDPTSRLLIAADSNIFFDTCDFTTDGNLRFFDNLWALSAPPASGTGGGTSSSTSSTSGG